MCIKPAFQFPLNITDFEKEKKTIFHNLLVFNFDVFFSPLTFFYCSSCCNLFLNKCLFFTILFFFCMFSVNAFFARYFIIFFFFPLMYYFMSIFISLAITVLLIHLLPSDYDKKFQMRFIFVK